MANDHKQDSLHGRSQYAGIVNNGREGCGASVRQGQSAERKVKQIKHQSSVQICVGYCVQRLYLTNYSARIGARTAISLNFVSSGKVYVWGPFECEV